MFHESLTRAGRASVWQFIPDFSSTATRSMEKQTLRMQAASVENLFYLRHLNIQTLLIPYISAFSWTYTLPLVFQLIPVNLLLLTRPGWAGVINSVIGQVLWRGAIPLNNITFDVNELSRLSKIEQAQRLEEAERRIDAVQRAAADDPDSLNWVSQQRQYLVDMQHLIFEC